jgi:hypothetical protein
VSEETPVTHDPSAGSTTGGPQAGTGARRRRPLLASATVLGLVLGLLGFAGVFTSGTDRALTGTNDLTTPGQDQAPAVDLRLATVSLELIDQFTVHANCNDDWSDDLETGIMTSESTPLFDFGQPGTLSTFALVCVANVGTASARVGMTVPSDSIVDSETGCEPDEEEGDCGEVGELSGDLVVSAPFYGADGHPACITQTLHFDRRWTLAQLGAGTAITLVDLGPGGRQVVCIGADWSTVARSQSDKVEWVFAFDGTEQP